MCTGTVVVVKTYRVAEIHRPLPHVFVFPLVKPTEDEPDMDGEVLRYIMPAGAGSGRWQYRHADQLELGEIWQSPRLSQPFATRPSEDFIALAQRLANGEFGTLSPPFEFPRIKPTESHVLRWIDGIWSHYPRERLRPGYLWWPTGDAAHQLYGRPESEPIEVT